MPIIREIKDKNYTRMTNYHFKDRRLSLKAKGLLSLMLSLPENWEFSISGLSKLSLDGSDGVRSAIQELERCGYVSRRRFRNAKGQFTVTEYSVLEKPMTEKPTQVFPTEETATQSNTNQFITKESNTNLSNPIVSSGMGKDVMLEQQKQLLRQSMDYDALICDHPENQAEIDSFVELMAETLCGPGETLWIAGEERTKEQLKKRFLGLTKDHIEYVQECLRKNTTPIQNIRRYVLAALYNAPATMETYYANRVAHDLAVS